MTAGLAAGANLLTAIPLRAQGVADPLSRDAVLRDPDVPVLGNPEGDITIVEFFDYQCPHCRKIHPVLFDIVRNDGKIRLVVKDWPIFGEDSVYAAKLSLASKYQEKYREAHEALITASRKLTRQLAHERLAQAGIDLTRATRDADIHANDITALLLRNDLQAKAFGFPGTPAFIIGTFRVPGVLTAEGFHAAIADARKAAVKP